MPEPALRHPLERQHRARQRALVVRYGLRGAAPCALVIAGAVLIGALAPTGVTGAWLRLAGVAALGVAAALAAAGRFRRESLTLDAYLERAEERFPAIRSWLRNALDLEGTSFPWTSPELAGALAEETRRRITGLPLATLTPPLAPRRPAFLMAGAAAALVLLGVLSPARTSRSWATLWNPSAAAPPVRLAVEPGSVTVTPGATLAVRARVWGTDRAPRLLRDRAPAPPVVPEGRLDDGARVWRFDLTQLTTEQEYRVRVASVESPRYRIGLTGEPAPVSFEIEYRAPAYARLPVQRGSATRGDLTALRGTRATVLVTFDRDLETLEARLPGLGAKRWAQVTPRRWQGEVVIDREGEYELTATGGNGSGARREGRFRYRVTPLADAPPMLAVRTPEGDLDLPAGQQIPIDVLAQDDLGLADLRLQYRKDPADPWTTLPLARFPARPRDAQIASRWDASALGLLPGQAAAFRFELLDNNVVSGPGRALSPTFELRFPSLAELYDRVDQKQESAQAALQKVAEQANELQKSLEKLSRQPSRPSESSQSFERREEFRNSLERQQQLGEKIDQAAQELRESLEQAAERQAFDQQLTRKLQELSELAQQIQSQEFKDAVRRMKEALENMDRQQMETDLQKLREQNQQTLANLQRTIELLKKLREEERLQSLAQRADELKAQQQALNQQHEAPPNRDAAQRDAESRALAEQQKQAAQESDQLARDAREESKAQENPATQEQINQAADELAQQASPAQRDAAQSASKGERSKSQQSGRKASESLSRAAEMLHQMANQAQQDQNEVDLAAVRRAAQDLVALQRSTEENMGSSDSPQQKADRQTDLSEGTARVADSLYQLSRQTPFISQKLARSLGRAITGLQSSGRELGSGNRMRGEEAGQRGREALNEAVLELRAAEGGMCNKPGMGKPGGRSNPRRLGEVGQRQSQLNRDSRTLTQRLSQQMRISTGDRNEMQRLAEEQARIRQQLEEIRRDEESRRQLLGRLDQAQREMKEAEEQLRSGNADGSLEEKQQRILSRLLDAQRSINRRDFNPERESRPGEDIVRASPAPLPGALLRENDRLRLDLLRAEADRYPAQYRAFVEAYLRSLNGSGH